MESCLGTAHGGLFGEGCSSRSTPGSSPGRKTSLGYTVVHSWTVAVLFVDTRPVDAIAFHHDLLGADDPKSFFTLPG